MPKQSTTPFTYYSFRYDYDDLVLLGKIKKYIEVNIPKYAIFDEISDDVKKKHIQGKIGVKLSLVQLKKNLNKEFPNVFVRSNYSIADIKKPDDYDSYIAKDGKVFMNNIPEFTQEYITEQVKKHKTLVTAFENKKQKSESSKTFTEKVTEDFIKENPIDCDYIRSPFYKPNDYEKKLYDIACQKLLQYILKRLGKISKVFDDNILQRMYNGIKNGIIQTDDKCSHLVMKSYENRIQL